MPGIGIEKSTIFGTLTIYKNVLLNRYVNVPRMHFSRFRIFVWPMLEELFVNIAWIYYEFEHILDGTFGRIASPKFRIFLKTHEHNVHV